MAIWSRHKVNKLSKGFLWRRKNCFVVQIRAVYKSLQYQYIWRKLKRRIYKQENIKSLNAAVREHGVCYSKFIYCLNRSNINLDRKILADLAQNEPYSFKAVFDEVTSQVKPLQHRKPDEVTFQEALSRGLIYPGPYVHKDSRDIHARYIMPKEGEHDYFGTGRSDYPYFWKDELNNYRKSFLKTKLEKKLPMDYYDDIPEVEEDDIKF